MKIRAKDVINKKAEGFSPRVDQISRLLNDVYTGVEWGLDSAKVAALGEQEMRRLEEALNYVLSLDLWKD